MSNTTRIISNLSKLENQFHTFHGEHNDQIQRLIDDCLRAVYQPSYGEPTNFPDRGEPIGFLDSWAAKSFR